MLQFWPIFKLSGGLLGNNSPHQYSMHQSMQSFNISPPLPATPAHGILIFTEWFVKIPSPPARAKGLFKCPILYFCKRQNQCRWLSIYWPTFWGLRCHRGHRLVMKIWVVNWQTYLFQHEPLQRDPANTLSKFTFCLPSCRISESTEKLMNLAYETLIEATQSTPQWYEQ